MKVKIMENSKSKLLMSEKYNYDFDKRTGFFARWGKTKAEDPLFSPVGPEILDLELSVNGCPNNCAFCYKDNKNTPATNMTLETYKQILAKMGKQLTQVALGITGVQTNPDFISILEHTRACGIIPNFTLSGIDLTQELAEKISKLVGAVAVSAYESNKNVCYDTVNTFVTLGIKQTNIHLTYFEENISFVYEVFNDYLHDPRLKHVNAIVLLKLKPKGRALGNFHSLSQEKFQALLKFAFDHNIPLGMDSCSAPDFEIAVEKLIPEEQKSRMLMLSESCESFGLFSSYIDVHGNFYPCSFSAGEGEWQEGLSVLNCENFLKDIWYSEKLNKYRRKSLDTCYKSGCRKCLIFPEINPMGD